MAIKRMVDIGFWTDDKVVEVFSPEDKYFMLYLLTNPHTTQLGIYQVNKKVMAFETGYSIETIVTLIDRFQNKYKLIHYNRETNEIGIINFLKHSIVKGGKPVEDLLVKELGQVKDTDMVDAIFENIGKYPNLNETVKKVISIYKQNDNDNDNDNDVSYHDSYHDSYDDSSKGVKKPKEVKTKYGDVVTLTEVEYNKIVDRYGKKKADDYIETVDLYCMSHNKTYKNYYATVLNFIKGDEKRKTEKQGEKMTYSWEEELKAEQKEADAKTYEPKRDANTAKDIFNKL
jgi:hypothetical protein